MLKYSVITASALSLCACTHLFSGDSTVAVAPNDSDAISTAWHRLRAPNITATADPDHKFTVIKFAFDGTLNDRARVPLDERPTIVSYIARRINVPEKNYYPGAGMQGQAIDWSDAARGASMFHVANTADKQFFDEAGPFLRENPNGEVRVFVTGFSRGAATARQFMNIVDDAWQHKFHDLPRESAPKLRFYALLYDTVSTGQNNTPDVRLGLPRDVNYSMHFVARDEPRALYKVDIDSPDQAGPTTGEGINRINTIYLPGAHSDIGASYPSGVGDAYRQITDYSLSMLGLISDQCIASHSDPTLFGKHDSRGWFDIVTRTPGPNSDRSTPRLHLGVIPDQLTLTEASDIRVSNERLYAVNSNRLIQYITEHSETFGFAATRDGKELKLVEYPGNLVHPGAVLIPTPDGGATFVFSFLYTPWIRTTIQFSPQVVRHIKPTGSTVSVTYLEIGNDRQQFNTFVDNVSVETQIWHRSGLTEKFSNGFTCPADSPG